MLILNSLPGMLLQLVEKVHPHKVPRHCVLEPLETVCWFAGPVNHAPEAINFIIVD